MLSGNTFAYLKHVHKPHSLLSCCGHSVMIIHYCSIQLEFVTYIKIDVSAHSNVCVCSAYWCNQKKFSLNTYGGVV